MDKKIQLYFITGFLGAGKTTLLLKMLDHLSGNKVGVIVNEFGSIGVDGRIISRGGIEMTELNNGQIFCSCLAADFIKATAAFAGTGVEYLLVETSGLALPKTITSTVETIQTLSGDAFEYCGMVCVTDTGQFEDLIDVVKAFEEQILYSDTILVNKIDLADEETISGIEKQIAELHPGAAVYRCLHCDAVEKVFISGYAGDTDDEGVIIQKPASPESRGSADGSGDKWHKPKRLALKTEAAVEEGALKDFLQALQPLVFRIKGYLRGSAGVFYVDVTGTAVSVTPDGTGEGSAHNLEDTEAREMGLVVIYNDSIIQKEEITSMWEQEMNVPVVPE